jgi:hypothetical protein
LAGANAAPTLNAPDTTTRWLPFARRIVRSEDGYWARVLDPQSRNPITRPLWLKSPLRHAAYDAPAAILVTVCENHTARVWDVQSGLPITPVLIARPDVQLGPVQLKQGWVRPANGGAGGWEVSTGGWTARDLVRLVQLYHGHRLDAFNDLIPLTRDELVASWLDLRAKYPTEFAVSASQAMLWRYGEILSSVQTANWAGVRLHFSALIRKSDGRRPSFDPPPRPMPAPMPRTATGT